mgnify:CR=1 FL=1
MPSVYEKAGPPPYGTRRKILDALRERADRHQTLELSVMLQGHCGNRPLAEAAHIEFGSWKAVMTALEKDMAKSRKAR